MKKLSEMPRNLPKKIIVYGPPKSGKTRLVGSVASKYKVIWFDLENGYETLFQLPPEAQDNITLISLPDTRSFPVAVETCLKVIKGTPQKICDAHGKISCAACLRDSKATWTEVNLGALGPDTVVVFDSLTQFTNSAIAHITKDRPDDYKLQHDDWGNLGKLCDLFLSHVQQAPFHVVCISHETEAELEDSTETNRKAKVVPTAGTRNFSRNTARYFGHVIYCEVKNRKHIAASSSLYASNILTGSRSGIALESSNADLLPILEGVVPETPAAPTPATSAVSGLAALRAKLGTPQKS